MIHRSENRSQLVTNGFVIYLNPPLEILYQRTAHDRNRPMLHTDDDPRQRIRELLEARDPLYRQVADLVVETGRNSSRFVVRDIIDGLPQ